MRQSVTLLASDRRATSRLQAISPSRQKTHQGLRADNGWLYRLLALGDSALEVIDAAREVRFALVSQCRARRSDAACGRAIACPENLVDICIAHHSALPAEMDGAQFARVSSRRMPHENVYILMIVRFASGK